MRYITFLFSLLPFLLFAQVPTLEIDTLGNSSKIHFIGPYNTIQFGYLSGNTLTTGLNNIYFGQLNGSSNTTGSDNISIGSNAGKDNTTGNKNINVGVLAGSKNQTGTGNVNIGDSAGFANVTGSRNVKLGCAAGAFSQGSDNIFIGNEVGANYVGDNRLMIDNSSTSLPLLDGDFANDILTINGKLHVTGTLDGNINADTIISDNLIGLPTYGNSAFFPEVLDNTTTIEIYGIVDSEFLITKSIGFQIDTFSTNTGINGNFTGFNAEFPLVFETDNPTDIAALNNWNANPSWRSLSIILNNVAGFEEFRYNLYEYKIHSISPGSNGRTSFTLTHRFKPNNILHFENAGVDFGTEISYNALTDKVVEISGVSHANFCPAVEVDENNKVVTLEMTYDEGGGIWDWVNGFAEGDIDKKAMSIIETINGPSTTELYRFNYFEVMPFQYEVVYGFGMTSKLKIRIKLKYGFSEQG